MEFHQFLYLQLLTSNVASAFSTDQSNHSIIVSEPAELAELYPLVIFHNYGRERFSMGKLTISVAIFNGYVGHYQMVNLLVYTLW